ncbi:hypothetical protein [Yaniella flava]|uniref:hypothetical protein n=1 Tax=Yaniella flava TaxID=287930 RepID=UPI0031E00F61
MTKPTSDPASELSISRKYTTASAGATAGTVPLVGSILGTLAGNKIRAKYETALREWLDALAGELNRVRHDLDYLLEDDDFIETLTAVTEAAVRASHQERLDTLKTRFSIASKTSLNQRTVRNYASSVNKPANPRSHENAQFL